MERFYSFMLLQLLCKQIQVFYKWINDKEFKEFNLLFEVSMQNFFSSPFFMFVILLFSFPVPVELPPWFSSLSISLNSDLDLVSTQPSLKLKLLKLWYLMMIVLWLPVACVDYYMLALSYFDAAAAVVVRSCFLL